MKYLTFWSNNIGNLSSFDQITFRTSVEYNAVPLNGELDQGNDVDDDDGGKDVDDEVSDLNIEPYNTISSTGDAIVPLDDAVDDDKGNDVDNEVSDLLR